LLTLAHGDDKGGHAMVGVPGLSFGGVEGAVRWSSGARMGSSGGSMTSSCLESGQEALGQLIEERR
jgi:hypothetical protein